MVKTLVALAALLLSASLSAQLPKPEVLVLIEDLTPNDQGYMARQVEYVDKIARTRLGAQVRGNLEDLTLLQRIIDQKLIATDDKEGLQSMGAVLGQVMAADVPSLEWKIYRDKAGRSRALCARNTQQCLFPITMLSRRVEVGLTPDVSKVYSEALALIDPYVAQIPYGGGPERRLSRP